MMRKNTGTAKRTDLFEISFNALLRTVRRRAFVLLKDNLPLCGEAK